MEDLSTPKKIPLCRLSGAATMQDHGRASLGLEDSWAAKFVTELPREVPKDISIPGGIRSYRHDLEEGYHSFDSTDIHGFMAELSLAVSQSSSCPKRSSCHSSSYGSNVQDLELPFTFKKHTICSIPEVPLCAHSSSSSLVSTDTDDGFHPEEDDFHNDYDGSYHEEDKDSIAQLIGNCRISQNDNERQLDNDSNNKTICSNNCKNDNNNLLSGKLFGCQSEATDSSDTCSSIDEHFEFQDENDDDSWLFEDENENCDWLYYGMGRINERSDADQQSMCLPLSLHKEESPAKTEKESKDSPLEFSFAQKIIAEREPPPPVKPPRHIRRAVSFDDDTLTKKLELAKSSKVSTTSLGPVRRSSTSVKISSTSLKRASSGLVNSLRRTVSNDERFSRRLTKHTLVGRMNSTGGIRKATTDTVKTVAKKVSSEMMQVSWATSMVNLAMADPHMSSKMRRRQASDAAQTEDDMPPDPYLQAIMFPSEPRPEWQKHLKQLVHKLSGKPQHECTIPEDLKYQLKQIYVY